MFWAANKAELRFIQHLIRYPRELYSELNTQILKYFLCEICASGIAIS